MTLCMGTRLNDWSLFLSFLLLKCLTHSIAIKMCFPTLFWGLIWIHQWLILSQNINVGKLFHVQCELKQIFPKNSVSSWSLAGGVDKFWAAVYACEFCALSNFRASSGVVQCTTYTGVPAQMYPWVVSLYPCLVGKEAHKREILCLLSLCASWSFCLMSFIKHVFTIMQRQPW